MDIQNSRDVIKTVVEVKSPAFTKHKLFIGTYIILGLSSLAIYYFLRFQYFEVFGQYRDIGLRLSLASFFSFVVLILSKFAERIVVNRVQTKGIQYNFIRLIRLLSVIIIAFIAITFLNENWYTAAVSLGLISLILGFALQGPISSLIGWFYIVIRAPYKVGDRIQVDTFTGDVVEISYLDTTLWEFAGSYMTNDLPSGRLIRFPNSYVWQNGVYNYSWKKFPYIWNEIPFFVAYESDFDFIEKTIREVAKAELGEKMEERIEQMRAYIKETPVDELEIKEYPFINIRVHENTWIEVLLIYLVHPKKAGAVRSSLIKKSIAALMKEPGKVMFPKSNSR